MRQRPTQQTKHHFSSAMVSSFAFKATAALLSASTVSGFKVGSYTTETHPKMTWKRCTGKGGSNCSNVNGEVVIDSNWRWLHKVGDYKNCYDGNQWDTSVSFPLEVPQALKAVCKLTSLFRYAVATPLALKIVRWRAPSMPVPMVSRRAATP